MTVRTIPSNFATHALSQIDALLDSVEQENSVSILIAIESGSRAWGFPSPDSDYDCRFIYVRRLEDYLPPWSPRDVIETPLVGELDVNGWDLGKALKLMLKGNAVIIEWLMSPIAYRGNAQFRSEFLALAEQHSNRDLIAKHYLHLGLRQLNTYFGDRKDVALKKIFYALRPAAALRWMRLHPELRLPPMDFPKLFEASNPPRDVATIVTEMLALKAVTHELGSGPIPAPIMNFVDAEFALASNSFVGVQTEISVEVRTAVAAFFRKWVIHV